MWKPIKWIIINSLMTYTLYLGIYENITGAANIFITMTWIMFIASWSMQSGDGQAQLKKIGRSVPAWLDNSYDAVITLTLIWYGWWWTGIAYLIHWGLSNIAWNTIKEEKTDVETSSNYESKSTSSEGC